jgi:SAM-dependent methyltransferase
VSEPESARAAADHDLVFADWDANIERVVSIMSAHLPVARGTLLDATCGTGMACDAASRMGWQVVGADGSAAMLERARERLPEIDFRLADVRRLHDTVRVQADAVISIGDGLPALPRSDLAGAVAQLRHSTRLGGTAMIVVRDFAGALRSAVWRDDPVCRVTALFVARDGGRVEYTLEIEDADGIRTHTRMLQAVSELELRARMEASGYHVRRSGRMLGRVVLSGVAV